MSFVPIVMIALKRGTGHDTFPGKCSVQIVFPKFHVLKDETSKSRLIDFFRLFQKIDDDGDSIICQHAEDDLFLRG